MAILVFVLTLFLLAAGAAGAYMSLDLLPTSIGVLYALAGAVAAAMAVVTFALGLLIRKIDRLEEAVRQSAPDAGPRPEFVAEPPLPEPPAAEPLSESELVAEEVEAPGNEAPVNENRAGHLPTLDGIEAAIETPEAPPALIGRYSSGGASYMIFADGSIEAETTEGAYKFASMGDFKRYLADRAEERADQANEKKS